MLKKSVARNCCLAGAFLLWFWCVVGLSAPAAMAQPHGYVEPDCVWSFVRPEIEKACTALEDLNRSIRVLEAQCAISTCAAKDVAALTAARELRAGRRNLLSDLVRPIRDGLKEARREGNKRWRVEMLTGLGITIVAIVSLAIAIKLWRVAGGGLGIVAHSKRVRASGVPRWLLRDLRQAAIIAFGVLAALLMWSLLL